MELRSYQKRIADVATETNAVVLLPAGAGKTVIAAEVISRIGAPALFFVPFISLVGRQATRLRSWRNMPSVEELHGETTVPPKDFSVLVTTPNDFLAAQWQGGDGYSWDRFGVVIFSEVHEIMEDNSYRMLALDLKESGYKPRIIGLTASFECSAANAGKIAQRIGKLCKTLQISIIEYADDTELREGGFKDGLRRDVVALMRLPQIDPCTDVVTRKPHLMQRTFFDRIRTSDATPFSREMVKMIQNLEGIVRSVDEKFETPLERLTLKKWVDYANNRIVIHPHYDQLRHWYEALRLIVTSWEEGEDLAMILLRLSGCHKSSAWPDETTALINNFFVTKPSCSARLEKMCAVLNERIHEMNTFRGVMFVQQRIMTHIVKYVIDQHPQLGKHINARCLYSKSATVPRSLAISKLQAKEALQDFASGDANLLIIAPVAGEILDIPPAKCILYFDEIQDLGHDVESDNKCLIQDQDEEIIARQAFQKKVNSWLKSNQNFEAEQFDAELEALVHLKINQKAYAHQILYAFLFSKTHISIKESLQFYPNMKCKLIYELAAFPISVIIIGKGKKSTKREAAMKLLKIIKDSLSCILDDGAEKTAFSKIEKFCNLTNAILERKFESHPTKKKFKLTLKSNVQAWAVGETKKEARSKAAINLLKELKNMMHLQINAMELLNDVTKKNALFKLNGFCVSTKVPIEPIWNYQPVVEYKLMYESTLGPVSAVGYARRKKRAKSNATDNLIRALLDKWEKQPARKEELEQHVIPTLLNNVTENTALSKLDTFCAKTKINFEEKWEKHPKKQCRHPKKQCTLIYKSGSHAVSAVATGDNRKVAKRRAAVKLLEALKDSLGKNTDA